MDVMPIDFKLASHAACVAAGSPRSAGRLIPITGPVLVGAVVVVVVAGTVEVVAGEAPAAADFPLDTPDCAPPFWLAALPAAPALASLDKFSAAWPAASTEAIPLDADGVGVRAARAGCALAGCSSATDERTKTTVAATRTATITRRGLILKKCKNPSSRRVAA
jgi:hypothetical protein